MEDVQSRRFPKKAMFFIVAYAFIFGFYLAASTAPTGLLLGLVSEPSSLDYSTAPILLSFLTGVIGGVAAASAAAAAVLYFGKRHFIEIQTRPFRIKIKSRPGRPTPSQKIKLPKLPRPEIKMRLPKIRAPRIKKIKLPRLPKLPRPEIKMRLPRYESKTGLRARKVGAPEKLLQRGFGKKEIPQTRAARAKAAPPAPAAAPARLAPAPTARLFQRPPKAPKLKPVVFSERLYYCPACLKRFVSREELAAHEAEHMRETPKIAK